MSSPIKRSRQRNKGQTMVEFALTLPLLALLLFGIMQYGFIFAAYMTVRNASAVGARYATLTNPTPTSSQIQSFTQASVGPMLQTSLATVTVQQNVTVGGVGGAKSVQVRYDLPLIIPFVVPGKTSGDSLTLTATTIMR